MQLLRLTRPTPAENIALDDALVLSADAGDEPLEVLRLWEPARTMVVVGRASRIADEVHVTACRRDGVPILRRPSGGTAIVAGPGCLMYSLVLSYAGRPELRLVDRAHRLVMETMAAGLRGLEPAVAWQGTCDLTLGERKFAGHSVRCRREHLLYHGTLLYSFDLDLIDRYLPLPPRMPNYRAGRPHRDFVTNLHVGREALERTLIDAWQADTPLDPWPEQRTHELAAEQYSRAEWTWSR